jgi:hypothetical protein
MLHLILGNSPKSETLSRESLLNVIDLFEQRKQRFEFTKTNPPIIGDPSL